MRALCISRMSFSVSPLFSAQRGTVKPYGDRIHGDRILVTRARSIKYAVDLSRLIRNMICLHYCSDNCV